MNKKIAFFITSLLIFSASTSPVMANHHSETKIRKIDIVNEIINGKKRYSPAVMMAKKGEEVILTIYNQTDQPHGFAIDEFKVRKVLLPGKNEIKFKANKSGLFRVYCQLHPAHLSGQLLILE